MRSSLLLAAILVGCGSSGEVHILAGACPFGSENHLFDLDGPVLDDLAAAPLDRGAYLAWSERSGLFGVALGPDGTALSERQRLGPACAGGVDVLAHGDRTLVACGVAGDVERDERGAVVVYERAADGAVRVLDRRGGVGDGHGVSLAAHDDEVIVGWQDATGASSSAWLVEVASPAEPIRLSRGGFRASAPALAYDAEGHRLVAWGELWNDDRGDAQGRMVLQVAHRGPIAVGTLAYELPIPVLVEDAPGAILAFRDRRPARTRPTLQLARITADTRELTVAAGAPANAAGGGIAVPCQGAVMVVAPRTHSRTERLVSVRRHGLDLAGLGPEQQLYEHAATFEWADALCLGDRLLVVFGSRASPDHPTGTVRSVTVDCSSVATPTE
ncbi:MAG: hypothetical protein U0234_03215 [Sandaracinus sp.]